MTCLTNIFFFMSQIISSNGMSIKDNGIRNDYIRLNDGTFIHYPLFSYRYDLDMFMNNLFIIITAYAVSSFIVMFIFSNILYRNKEYVEAIKDRDSDISDDDISDDDISDNDSDIESDSDGSYTMLDFCYESQYFTELEELTDREIDSDIGGHTLIEETPNGIVHMKYNMETGIFEYYTDKFSDMTYEILDTVARLFAVTFNCKRICVNYRDEIQNGTNKMLSEIEFDKLMLSKEQEADAVKEKERSVFASFKKYNKKTGNNVDKKYFVITEKANRFKFKGKIVECTDASANVVDDYIKISYSEFKKLHMTSDKSHGMSDKPDVIEESDVTTMDKILFP